MRPETFQSVVLNDGFEGFPLRSTQSAATVPSLMHLTFVAVLAAAVVLPQLGLASYAIWSPTIRQMVIEQPLVAFQLAVAMAFWIAVFAWPLRSLVARLTCRRAVEITRDSVAVDDQRAFGRQQWTAPLTAYRGITHHIRSSLSGTRHELLLVHPDAERSVLLMAADHITDAEIHRMASLLDLPEVPAGALFGPAIPPRAIVTQSTALARAA
jgi:hypothetical protein